MKRGKSPGILSKKIEASNQLLESIPLVGTEAYDKATLCNLPEPAVPATLFPVRNSIPPAYPAISAIKEKTQLPERIALLQQAATAHH